MNQATCCGWNKQGMPRCTREYGRGLPCEFFCWSVTLTLLLIVCIYSWYMQVHQRIFWYHSVAGVWLDYPPLTTCNNTPAHGTTDLKPKRFPFFYKTLSSRPGGGAGCLPLPTLPRHLDFHTLALCLFLVFFICSSTTANASWKGSPGGSWSI